MINRVYSIDFIAKKRLTRSPCSPLRIFNLIERWVLINARGRLKTRPNWRGSRFHARLRSNDAKPLRFAGPLATPVFGAPRTTGPYSFEKDRKWARVQFRRPGSRVSGRRNNSAASKSARLHAPSRFNELCCVRIR